MNPPELFSVDGDAGGNRPSPRKELQLQGPRPAALKVNKDSHKIRKPPVAPPPHHHQPLHGAPPQPSENRQPVIIYAVPPKIIHTTVNDYKSLVQRLTGNTTTDGASSSSSAYAGAGVGDLSPAARLASIEKMSPRKDREAAAANGGADNEISNLTMGDFVGDTNVEMGAVPGILSPAPGSLPPISPGFFSPALPPISPGLWSPAGDPFTMGYNMFATSPSTLFTAPLVSPSPSSCDLFNPFL